LESLQRRFKDKKFTVLGFPSRNFMGQEFRDEEKVSEFCKATFDVSFPLFSIANVKNSTNHPFYKKIYKLTRERPSWNFHKYLITSSGEIKSFSHRIDPEDAQIVSAIQDSINL
jgi:glutathione peroxidase